MNLYLQNFVMYPKIILKNLRNNLADYKFYLSINKYKNTEINPEIIIFNKIENLGNKKIKRNEIARIIKDFKSTATFKKREMQDSIINTGIIFWKDSKIPFIISFLLVRLYKIIKKKDKRVGKSITEKVATIAPRAFAFWAPTKVAIFNAIGPGVIWAIPTIFQKSDVLKKLNLLTIRSSIIDKAL